MVKRTAAAAVAVEEKKADRREPKYKGIRKRKWGKWVSEIRLPNSRERIWLGSYDSPKKAARAFDAALFCLRGHTASFNFPDNPPDIEGGRSLSPPEIRAAASKFANSGYPINIQSDHSVSEYQVESPCLSIGSESDLRSSTTQIDGSELEMDIPFLDLLMNSDTGTEYGIFPGFDDLQLDFFDPLTDFNLDFGEENFDGFVAEDSFLWNF